MIRTQTDGRPAVIRQTCAADLAELGAFFAGLSVQTRYRRFFAAITPSQGMLRVLSGSADHVDVLVAVRGGSIVGHAMAVDRIGKDGAWITDTGLVVADAWQGKGVGSALMSALVARARARGVTVMAMDVLHSNSHVLAMITSHWPAARAEHTRDGITIHVRLPPPRLRPSELDLMARPAGMTLRRAVGRLGPRAIHRCEHRSRIGLGEGP